MKSRDSKRESLPPQAPPSLRADTREKSMVFNGQAPGALAESAQPLLPSSAHRIFLISPANAAGIRARSLLKPGATSELATRLRTNGATLAELFTFMSSLYFRGKLAYAAAFAHPPANLPGAFVITPSRGLQPPETLLTQSELEAMFSARIDLENETYRTALYRDARLLLERLPHPTQIILLGSIASPKYTTPLLEVFGEQLLFPHAFVGRGDMSRGGLLLRCCRTREELAYVPVATTVRNGQRPAKLAPLRSARSA